MQKYCIYQHFQFQLLIQHLWIAANCDIADERFDATFHTNVLVNSSGHCQYLPPGIFKSSCYIDVRWFPFDVQHCKLKFGSWSYGGWSLDLQMQEADISGYIPNG
ncbi:CHRNA7 (exons 5-10) and FAM7A (exons A-E) fusion, partial [Homo sapiens]